MMKVTAGVHTCSQHNVVIGAAYDPYSLQHRPYARMDLYNAANACSAFRTWQGWMSLSDCAPNGGTLRVLPLLREATAFVLLRPFLEGALSPRTHLPLRALLVEQPTLALAMCLSWIALRSGSDDPPALPSLWLPASRDTCLCPFVWVPLLARLPPVGQTSRKDCCAAVRREEGRM